MKITLKNLEKLIYRRDRNEWQNKYQKNRFYVYIESCKNCGEPFLAVKNSKRLFCSEHCSNSGENNNIYGTKRSQKTKEKISIRAKERLLDPKYHSNYKGGVTEKNIPFYDTYAPQIDFCESIRRNEQDPNILEVKCTYCGGWYVPTMINIVNRIQALKGKISPGTENRLYCSEQCKKKCPIYRRIKWHKDFKPIIIREVQAELRQICLERDNYTCQICGKKEKEIKLHCHHYEGIMQNPIESADIDNCITLCKECHKQVHELPGCGYHELKCK